ncbi:MAG: MotA/TolQ/ExbB proton channel family protein [Tildeniella nuda ZEHNDER 1965/U140]|jgi:biopolymer transport protein ExbB|nr:MotA/TolQ/ExbB proton channel family protein [Tildeniella nuda ZEHNDER 1965/U140]
MQRIYELIATGGIVMVPLLVFSIAVIALAIERALFWRRARKQQKRVVRSVLQLYQDDLALTEATLQKHLHLPIARVFLEAVSLPNATPDEFRLALDAGTQAEIPNLKRFNNIFETIVGLAPLLGLLGTVTGLIRSFGSLTLGDVGSSKTIGVTAGISEALVSTAVGLVVAVLALIAANTFRSFYAQQIAYIDECCTQLELLQLRSYRRQEVSRV